MVLNICNFIQRTEQVPVKLDISAIEEYILLLFINLLYCFKVQRLLPHNTIEGSCGILNQNHVSINHDGISDSHFQSSMLKCFRPLYAVNNK